jgi:prevent-host-death family protein
MSVSKFNVREARLQFRRLLDEVQAGGEVVVMRRGVEVARIVGPERSPGPLPDLGAFRASLKVKGRPLGREISASRRSARY